MGSKSIPPAFRFVSVSGSYSRGLLGPEGIRAGEKRQVPTGAILAFFPRLILRFDTYTLLILELYMGSPGSGLLGL